MKKLVFKQNGEENVVPMNNIVSCHAASNFCTIRVNKGNEIPLSMNMKTLEFELDPDHFVRVHHSHVANINFIKKVKRKGSAYEITMTDESKIPCSRRKQQDLWFALQHSPAHKVVKRKKWFKVINQSNQVSKNHNQLQIPTTYQKKST